MQAAYDLKATNPAQVDHVLRAVGGSSAVTKVYGPGATVSRTGAGIYKWVFAENPGNYVGSVYGIEADTPGDLAGHTVVVDWDAATLTLNFRLYNASFALHDLAALEWITLRPTFARVGTAALR